MSILNSTKRFTMTPLSISGVVSVCRQFIGDERGSLSRLFCNEELYAAGWKWPVAQINHTQTLTAGTVRGMHYQNIPHTEAKLVTCIRGCIWDVALDLRVTSPTYLKWCAQELSASNQISLMIPPGCAHGFQSLTDDVEILYVHSHTYVPDADTSINPCDPKISIAWPLAITHISKKDINSPMLSDHFFGVRL